MDDLRLYNRALSATEIQQVYQPGNATLVSIAVTPANASIAKGATQQFTATGTYSDSSTQNLTSAVTWSSTSTSVVTITTGGLATGVATGSTTIQAASGSINGSTDLTVTPPVLVSIAVTPANASIGTGVTQQYTATGHYSDGGTLNLTSSVSWSSTSMSVATITSAGLATGVAAGSTTIQASLDLINGSTGLTVTSVALVLIAVTPVNGQVAQGATLQFTATGTYSDTSTLNLTSSVTWTSTNMAAATITSEGLATGVATGSSTTIQASSGLVSGSTPLTVTPAGLVGYWTFDDGSGTTAADSSGNGHPVTLVNGVSWVTGKIGGAISANEVNPDASIPAIDLSGTSAVTVAMWVNRTYSTAAADVWLEDSANFNSSTTGFGIFMDDPTCNGIQTGVHGDVGYTMKCYAQPSSGVWHHLGFIFDKSQPASNEVALYVDGVLQTPTLNYYTSDNTNSFGDNPIYLFSRGGSQFFSAGEMDDLRLYNRALSATEIQQVYQAGNATLGSIAVTPANASIAKGATQQFTATGTYSDSSTQNLTSAVSWSSTSTSVATINGTTPGLATAVAAGSTTIQATAGPISGSTGLTVASPFPGITYDMWVDFEQCTSGLAPTTTCLANSTHGTAGTWDVSNMAGLITIQTAAQAPNPDGDTGTLGMAYNLGNGAAGYIQWAPPSPLSSLSFGLWYKTSHPGDYKEGPHFITLWNATFGPMERLSDERSSFYNYRQIRVSPLDAAVTGLADNTWYWCTMKWVQGGEGSFSVYDASLNLVGTVTFTGTNFSVQQIQLGNSVDVSDPAQSGETTYFDDLIVDYTHANFPLVP
jgi:hypothetical protein